MNFFNFFKFFGLLLNKRKKIRQSPVNISVSLTILEGGEVILGGCLHGPLEFVVNPSLRL